MTMTFLVLCFFEVGSIAQKHDSLAIDFEFLQFKEGYLKSNHGIEFLLEIPKGYTKSNILNHTPVYHDHPFKVSAAAVYDTSVIIMVHAETLADNSGYLNYSYMDSTRLSGINFYAKEHCVEITEELIAQAEDLRFFQNEGFNFYPAVYLKQYFITTDDGNTEWVLSYGEKVCNCSTETINKSFKEQFLHRLENSITIKK